MTNTSKLKHLLHNKGYTQATLSQKIGISKQSLNNKVLNKREFTLEEVMKIQQILDLSLEEKEAIFFDNYVAINNNI